MYFKKVLQQVGVELSDCDEHHVVTKEYSLVIRDLTNVINENPSYNADRFLEGFKSALSDPNFLKLALDPMILKKSDCDNTPEQDSLVKAVLCVDALQKEMLILLFDKLTEEVSENNVNEDVVHLILNQLKLLPFITEPEFFVNQIFDIVDVANHENQVNILQSVSSMPLDGNLAAGKLSKMLESCENLEAVIMDCLNSFDICAETRYSIQDYVYQHLLNVRRFYKIFPLLFQFLFTDCRAEDEVAYLTKARNTLDLIMSSTNSDPSNKLVSFRTMQDFSSRAFYKSFVGMLSRVDEYKPIDLLLLIMLHHTAESQQKVIEQLFVKFVKEDHFTQALFERLYGSYYVQQLFVDYFDSNMKLAACLLHNHSDYSTLIYTSLFTHKYGTAVERSHLLNSLLCMNITTTLLTIFMELINCDEIKEHKLSMMALLREINNLNLHNVKLTFEILCKLAKDTANLKDELFILIRKHIKSCVTDSIHAGIVGAIVMIKHLIITTEHQNINPDESDVLIEQLPSNVQDAMLLLKSTEQKIKQAEILGLYYDELSSMIITTDNLDRYFLLWLYEKLTTRFTDNYAVEYNKLNIDGIQLESQFNILSEEEVEKELSLNIGELVIKEKQMSTVLQVKATTLCPLFRLLRLLNHKLYDGDLDAIGMLQGCGVLLPTLHNIDDYDMDQLKTVAHCLFYAINWFREVISAFVTQTSRLQRERTLQRIMHLQELEKLLRQCMNESLIDLKLPQSYFDISIDEKVKPRPKKKAKVSINDTGKGSGSSNKSGSHNNDLNVKFREIDTDLIVLLRYSLDCDIAGSQTSSQRSCMNVDQLHYILKDLKDKVSVLIKNYKITDTKSLHLTVINPINYLKDVIRVMPYLIKHFKAIAENLNKVIIDCDEEDEVLYSESTNSLKNTFLLLLEIFLSIIKWPGFMQKSKYSALYEDFLTSTGSFSSTLVTPTKLTYKFAEFLSTYLDHCLTLNAAVCLVELMQQLYQIEPSPELKKLIATTSEKLLKKKWRNLQGKVDNSRCSQLDVLIKAFLCEAKVKTLCGFVGTLQEECANLNSRNDRLKMLASINQVNLPMFYGGLCEALYERLKFEIKSLTNEEHLLLWRAATLTMQGLRCVAKTQSSKAILNAFLKRSIAIIKLFLSHGMPIMEMMIKNHQEKVLEIFKILQTSTRFLHCICCHVRTVRDLNLINHVPLFRLTLETLLLRVKTALEANKCSQSFWMGTLKNLNLAGEEILSQQSTTTDGDDEEYQDEDPVEDMDMDDDNDVINSSSSELY